MRHDRTLRGIFLAGVGLGVALAGACKDEGASVQGPPPAIRSGPPGARFPAASQDTSVPVRTRIAPSEDGPRLELSAARGGGGGGSIREPPGHVRGPTLTPDQAVVASRQASTRTGTREPCALAYQALLDVHRAYREATPRARRGPADRDRFMATCLEKPVAQQWCLVPSYIMTHAEDCDRDARTRYARAIERLSEGNLEAAAEVAETADANAGAEQPRPAGPERLGPREQAPAEEPAEEDAPAAPTGMAAPPTMEETPRCSTGDCG